MLLFFLWLLAAGPAPAPAAPLPPSPPTVLSGHLAHAPAGDTVRVVVGQRRYKAVLGPGGDFRLVLRGLAAAAPADLYYARQHASLYLAPGDQLHLTLDFREFDKTLRYTGRGAAPNNYLAQAGWQFAYGPQADALRPQPQLKPGTTPAEMRQLADTFRQRQEAFLAAYDRATPLPPAFRRDQALGITLDWGTQLLDYVAYHRDHAAGAAVPEGYFGFLKELPLAPLPGSNSPAENTRVVRLLNSYQNRLAPSGTLSPDPAAAGRLYALAAAELGSTPLRDLAMYQLLSWKLDDDLPGVLAAYPTFRALNHDSAYARSLHTVLAKRVVLAVGRPAPAFTLHDNTGRAVALQDLRGKVVYLDFWGTWCPPCMKEMTGFSHELKQKFEGRDVVFVYISVGDAEAKWQQVLATQHLTGPNSVHLRQPKEAQVAFDYQINAYPTYWLIGRDGLILDMQAPRPSDGPKTVAALEAALQQ